MKRECRNRTYSDEQFRDAVALSVSWAQVLRNLGLKYGRGQYLVLRSLAEELNVDTSHFLGRGWNVGEFHLGGNKNPIENVLVKDSLYSTYYLKCRLWKERLLEKKCYRCGSTEWFGQINHLQLEHINGDRTDNRLENLTILCANCHALTKTYCGKNKAVKKKAEKKKEVILLTWEEALAEARTCPVCGFSFFSRTGGIFCSDICRKSNTAKDIRERNKKIFEKVCPVCEKKFLSRSNQKYCSYACAKFSSRKVTRPSKEELFDLLKLNKGNFCAVARIFGVSDKAIRKWLRAYGSPYSIIYSN